MYSSIMFSTQKRLNESRIKPAQEPVKFPVIPFEALKHFLCVYELPFFLFMQKTTPTNEYNVP